MNETSPANRTRGTGTSCPKCAKYGFDLDSNAVYYSCKSDNGVWWWKGGITSDAEEEAEKNHFQNLVCHLLFP